MTRYILFTPLMAVTAWLLFVFSLMGGSLIALWLSLALGAAALLGAALYVLVAPLPGPVSRALGRRR